MFSTIQKGHAHDSDWDDEGGKCDDFVVKKIRWYFWFGIWVFPQIGGTPKWMFYNGSKPYQKMDDLRGPPLFLG